MDYANKVMDKFIKIIYSNFYNLNLLIYVNNIIVNENIIYLYYYMNLFIYYLFCNNFIMILNI